MAATITSVSSVSLIVSMISYPMSFGPVPFGVGIPSSGNRSRSFLTFTPGPGAQHALTDQALMMALRRRARQAGVAAFRPDDRRRTMVSHLLDAGVDIVTVQKLTGHTNVQTTAKYNRRGGEPKRNAARLRDIGCARLRRPHRDGMRTALCFLFGLDFLNENLPEPRNIAASVIARLRELLSDAPADFETILTSPSCAGSMRFKPSGLDRCSGPAQPCSFRP
jgi:hypothetical protein